MSDDTALPVLRQRPTRTAREVYASIDPDPTHTRSETRARSLYLHTPFCTHKCHYCDFYSIVDRFDRQEDYLTRLERELAAIAPFAHAPLETIFIGGGTPSLLRLDLWHRLLDALRERFDLSAILAGSGEFSVECNPESTTPELLTTLRAGGVNRISVGAQSFDPALLKTLERHHNPARVSLVLNMAADAGIPHRSLDLIYAIPGQTLDAWKRDLDTAIAMPVDHLSAYNLTYEPRTAMTARLDRGEFRPTEEDLEIEMFELTGQKLRDAGFDRYEISNYARPGGECRHNLAYWRQEPWLAAGPSASGHLGGHRWKHTPRLADYLARDDEGFAPIEDHELPDPQRALAERIMTGLRLREGIDPGAILAALSAIHADSSPDIAQAFQSRIDDFVRRGLIEHHAASVRLTDPGLLLADGLAAELMAIVDP